MDEKTSMSKSKAKREARRKEVEKIQQKKRLTKISGIAVIAVILLAVLGVIGKQVYTMAIRTTPASDYSAGLSLDGTISFLFVLSHILQV